MRIIKSPSPDGIPDYLKERDIFGFIKPTRLAIIKRVRYKSINAPDLSVAYAGLGIRTLAMLVDLMILICILMIPEYFLFSLNFSDIGLNTYRIFSSMALLFVYKAAYESSRYKATPGKMILKLKVVDLHGRRMSFGRAALRSAAMFISILPAGLGIWYLKNDPKKQSWHDLISGSYVIKLTNREYSDLKYK